jgi:hypothetical protein
MTDHLDIQDISDRAAALVAMIVNENVPHNQARLIVMGVIDALARLSGNRELFWGDMWDLVDAVTEQLETSHEIH